MRDVPVTKHNCRANVVYISVDQLFDSPNNPRIHPKGQIKQIEASIDEFGFTNPVLIATDHMIIAGHARVKAAKNLGYKEVPCLYLDHLTREQVRAYAIADNRHAEKARWDDRLLVEELSDIQAHVPDLDFDALGFSIPEIDKVFAIAAGQSEFQFDAGAIQPVWSGLPHVQAGDIWQCGRRRIVCVGERDQALIAALSESSATDIILAEKLDRITNLNRSKRAKPVAFDGTDTAPVRIACGWPQSPLVVGDHHG